jgi:hypothetical protein
MASNRNAHTLALAASLRGSVSPFVRICMYRMAAKSKIATPSNSVADYGMHELEFEPRNLREKWLLRIVYWGTILLVTFMLWEYVKAR